MAQVASRAVVCFALPFLLIPGLAGCSGDTTSTPASTTGAGGAGSTTTTADATSATSSSSTDTSSVSTSATTGTGGGVFQTCFDPRPAGAPVPPAPKAYSGGTCPTLVSGMNTINSGGNDRQFILTVPTDVADGEPLPAVFLWHWLGGSAQDFLEKGDVQTATDAYRFAAIIPEAKGDLQFQWPMDVTAKQSRIDEEVMFFDDMLACVSEQFKVIPDCVASTGVSAGALFTPVLAGQRGDYLSSMVILSGGTGGNLIQPWAGSAHKMAAMVLWGGPTDNCFTIMDFVKTSQDLEDHLTADGHFFLECIHNCGHSAPPFGDPNNRTEFAPMWEFVLDHPYWLAPGESPYTSEGIPASYPDWCGIGAGSATPRVGECTEPSGC